MIICAKKSNKRGIFVKIKPLYLDNRRINTRHTSYARVKEANIL